MPPSSTDTSPLPPVWATLKRFFPYLWPADAPALRRRVVGAMIFVALAKAVTLVMPFAYKAAIDRMAPGMEPAAGLAMALVVAYAGARFAGVFFDNLRNAIFEKVGQEAGRRLSDDVFVHLHRLSLRFHLDRRTGAVTKIVERGTKSIDTMLYFLLFNIAPTVLELAAVCAIFLVKFGAGLVFATLAMVALYILFTRTVTEWRNQLRRDMVDMDTSAVAHAVDSLLNFETVKYFGNEEMEAQRFDVAMARYEKSAISIWTSLGWLNFGQGVIFGLGSTVMMVMSALAVQRGEQTIGDFVFINALLLQLSVPLNFIGFVYREIRQGLADIEQMFELLEVEAEVTDRPGATPLAAGPGAISFRDVHFAYDAERPILKGISFDVPAGKTVAIVGPSGAGKSTISRLLYRFYDIQEGAITIDGQDVRDVTQKSLRSVIGMVPQDTVLFNDTLAYNIRYGRPSANDEDITAAADAAQISAFIGKLPDGYATMVGERGLKLSGGEKQRVAIARTILKAPPILILDEATSALDTHTEQEIQSALDIVSKNRTTLVIAHRLSTVIGADEIIVLKEGLIAERGTHTSLMAQNGLYASMWSRQREAIRAEEMLRHVRETDDLGVVDRGEPAH